jgi:hypothetical protein
MLFKSRKLSGLFHIYYQSVPWSCTNNYITIFMAQSMHIKPINNEHKERKLSDSKMQIKHPTRIGALYRAECRYEFLKTKAPDNRSRELV